MSVFSLERNIEAPIIDIPSHIKMNQKNSMDGNDLLSEFKHDTIPVCFFDPQYRGVLDHLNYGTHRQEHRNALKQMDDAIITSFIEKIYYVLIPTGHLFLWVDKFHVAEGVSHWLQNTDFEQVDMIVWYKNKIGLGHRTRRSSEFLLVFQKPPKRAKGVWQLHDIPDVWVENVSSTSHYHQKPLKLQQKLILAVTNKDDLVIDPAAGSYSVMYAATAVERRFVGCDINPIEQTLF